MHHRRDDHVLLDFQNLAHGVYVVVAPGRRKKRFRDVRTVLRGEVPPLFDASVPKSLP